MELGKINNYSYRLMRQPVYSIVVPKKPTYIETMVASGVY